MEEGPLVINFLPVRKDDLVTIKEQFESLVDSITDGDNPEYEISKIGNILLKYFPEEIKNNPNWPYTV